MLRWAEKRKSWRALLIDGNPAELVEINKLLPDDYDPVRTRLLSIEEVRELNAIFIAMKQNYVQADCKYDIERPLKEETQIAICLCLGTLCRIGELLMTQWKHVNFEDRTWFIPKANTKDDAGDQLVHLSDFTFAAR